MGDRPAVLAAGALVTACLAATLAGIALTLAPAEAARAWPLPGPAVGLAAVAGPVALVVAGLAGVLMVVAAAAARAHGWQRQFAGLILVYPLLHAGSWFVLGADGIAPSAWLAGTVLAAVLLVMVARAARERPPAPRRPAQRRWLVSDLVLVGGPVALGLAAGTALDPRAILVSAVFYPVFAAVQLAVFLVVPARWLRATGLGATGNAVTCALLFALLHWPHPLVMALTCVGMFVWASAWLRGRSVAQLALVMGLAATSASQFLPDPWTGHMRAGPRAVRVLAAADLALDPGPAAATADWLAAVYPRSVGRPPLDAELDRWRLTLAPGRRTAMAWCFYTSDEYAALAADGRRPPPPPAVGHWTDLPQEWRERIEARGGDDAWHRAGGDFAGFTVSLYRGILGREPANNEVASWSPDLTASQRLWLATWLLTQRHDLAAAPFDTVGLGVLRLPY